MVSFTTINTIFAKANWLDRFKDLLSIVYCKNRIRARVRANRVISKNNFAVNSGTKQGCPLSPLIYAVVADLYNMAIIAHKHFKGQETLQGHFVKISAYADDTAVHLGTLTDVMSRYTAYCYGSTPWPWGGSPTLISRKRYYVESGRTALPT